MLPLRGPREKGAGSPAAVDAAVVSHEAGTAIVTLNAEVSDADLKKAVEDQDYKVTGIE